MKLYTMAFIGLFSLTVASQIIGSQADLDPQLKIIVDRIQDMRANVVQTPDLITNPKPDWLIQLTPDEFLEFQELQKRYATLDDEIMNYSQPVLRKRENPVTLGELQGMEEILTAQYNAILKDFENLDKNVKERSVENKMISAVADPYRRQTTKQAQAGELEFTQSLSGDSPSLSPELMPSSSSEGEIAIRGESRSRGGHATRGPSTRTQQ